MQQHQIEELKRRIMSSTILSAQEKQDWLDMAEVMNDKQAADLDTILDSPVPVMPKNIPPLSHISNLPSNMQQVAPAKVKASLPGVAEWRSKVEKAVTEKELPSGPEEKLLTHPVQNAATVKIDPAPRVMPAKPVSTIPQRMNVVSPAKAAPASQPISAKPTAATALHLESPQDAAKMSIAQFRGAQGDLIARMLQSLVQRSNYFEVLFYLEKSPLYQAYLETGRKVLESQKPDFNHNGLLTKEEFENFSDLLQHIQIG